MATTRTKKKDEKRLLRLLIPLACVAVLAVFVIRFAEIEKTVEQQQYPVEYAQYVEENAAAQNLPKSLVYAVIRTESSFRADAQSGAGAMGLMQIMPDTFDFIVMKSGLKNFTMERAFDPEINIYCGTWFLRYLLDRYDDNLPVALAAYNAGMGNADKWLGDPAYSKNGVDLDSIPFSETEHYVEKVTSAKEMYEKLYGWEG